MRGRNFLSRVVRLDAIARAAGRRPALSTLFVSFDIRAAFPSLSRSFLWRVLERHRIPKGYLNVVSALYSGAFADSRCGAARHPLFLVTSGVAQGCPLSGTIWALCMDPFARHLHSQLSSAEALAHCPAPERWCPRLEPECGVTADDVGATLPSVRILPLLIPPFTAARTHANLELQPQKCCAVPLAEECTPSVAARVSAEITALAPEWASFHVRGCTPFLGFSFGPAATLGDQWAGPIQKWRGRTGEVALSRSPAEASCRVYNFGILSVLSYVCQLYPPSPRLPPLRASRPPPSPPSPSECFWPKGALGSWLLAPVLGSQVRPRPGRVIRLADRGGYASQGRPARLGWGPGHPEGPG